MLGVAQEHSTEGGGRAGNIGKFLLHGNIAGAVVWGRDMGSVGANGSEARRISCGFPDTSD